MIVKKDSWHYKLAESVWKFTYIPKVGNNLCKYFWMVIWAGFVYLFILLFCLFILLLVSIAFYSNIYTSISAVIAIFFGLCVFAIPSFAVFCFREYVGENIEISTPAILSDYAKAKKNKICPMIDFE